VVNDLEPKDRDIAMVFQNYALHPHMSVYDNMAYGLKIRGLARDDIRTRVNRAAEILELGSLLHVAHGGATVIARVQHGVHPAIGTTLHLAADPSNVYLFDAQSGARIT